MGKMSDEEKSNLAANIKACRMVKFPQPGSQKTCSEAFGVMQQQWSPWERGVRCPNKTYLSKLCDFFGVSEEWLKQDHGRTCAARRQAYQEECANRDSDLIDIKENEGHFAEMIDILSPSLLTFVGLALAKKRKVPKEITIQIRVKLPDFNRLADYAVKHI